MILLFVSDIECFTHEESWLSLFGELLFIQKPEDMELFPRFRLWLQLYNVF